MSMPTASPSRTIRGERMESDGVNGSATASGGPSCETLHPESMTTSMTIARTLAMTAVRDLPESPPCRDMDATATITATAASTRTIAGLHCQATCQRAIESAGDSATKAVTECGSGGFPNA
jgi:hypothetical protein